MQATGFNVTDGLAGGGMDKPDRTEVIERLNRILKPPVAAPTPERSGFWPWFASLLLDKRRLIAASAAR